MTIWDWISILAIIGIVLTLGIVFIKLSIKHKHIFIAPAYKKSHKRTEMRLLNYILDDMRSHPHEWVATPYDFNSQRSPHFVNDKKNIAVIVGNGSSKGDVVIKMNLTAAHKYMEHAEDTIATHVSGEHVVKFLRGVEECIDTRGKELSFAENILKEKL